MEKVFHALPLLPGEEVVLSDSPDTFIVESVNGVRFVTLVNADSKSSRRVRRVRAEVAFTAWLRCVQEKAKVSNGGVVMPNQFKAFVLELIEVSDEWRALEKAARSLANRNRKRKANLDAKETLAEKQAALRGPQLEKCLDKHTSASLEKQFETLSRRMEEVSDASAQVEMQRRFVFRSDVAIARFFTERGVTLTNKNVARWRLNGVRQPGGRPVFTEEQEKNFVEAILYLDARGFRMTREKVLEMASQVHGQGRQFTLRWYNAWVRRMSAHYPELAEARARTTGAATIEWLNTDNLKWWFSMLKSIALEHKLAREPREGEPGEIVWQDPRRVFVTDETCVSGGDMRTGNLPSQKVVTLKSRIEKEGKGSGYRRSPEERNYDEHITLVAGHNMAGETTLPVWVLTGNGQIRDDKRKEIEHASPKFPALAPYNGQQLRQTIVGVSTNGSVTTENIKQLMIPAFKAMYPDLANEDGKRVLWFTDLHGSRFSLELIKELRDLGVVLVAWLPNTTSKTQSPDVVLFGPLKSVLPRLETHWKMANPGKKLDRTARILLAGRALLQVFTPDRCLEGATRTGVMPVDRQALLKLPIVQDGNLKRSTSQRKAGTRTFIAMSTPKVATRGIPTSERSKRRTPSSNSEVTLLASPVRRSQEAVSAAVLSEQAESTFTSISQQQPPLGPRRLMSEGLCTSDEVKKELESLRKHFEDRIADSKQALIKEPQMLAVAREAEAEAKAEFRPLLDAANEELAQLMAKLDKTKLKVSRVQEDYRARITEVQQIPATIAARVRCQIASYERFQAELEEQRANAEPDAEVVARLSSVFEGMSGVPRDQFHLPLPDDDADHHPQLAHVPGSEYLKQAMTAHDAVIAGREKAKKRKINQLEPTDAVQFKAGALMHHTGTPNITSRRYVDAITEHEAKKANKAALDKQKAEQRAAAKKARLDALPERLRAVETEVRTRIESNKRISKAVANEWLIALRMRADVNNDQAMMDIIKNIRDLSEEDGHTGRLTALASTRGLLLQPVPSPQPTPTQ